MLDAWYCIRGLRPMSPRTRTWTEHVLSEWSHWEGRDNNKTVNKVEMMSRTVNIMVSGPPIHGAGMLTVEMR